MKGKKILIGTTLIVGFLSLFGYLVKKAGAGEIPSIPPIPPAPPPGTGEISGTVTKEGDAKVPVPGMLVTADGYSTLTDANGNWELWLPVGTYTVIISGAGYATQSRTMPAQVGRSNSWHIEFGPW